MDSDTTKEVGVSDITARTGIKIPKPKHVICQVCGGKGTVKRFPYYAENMPKKTKQICEYCDGYGKVLFIYKYVKVVRG